MPVPTLWNRVDGWVRECPGCGLEYGESLVAAAIREAKEEVGVTIAAEDLILRHSLHGSFSF